MQTSKTASYPEKQPFFWPIGVNLNQEMTARSQIQLPVLEIARFHGQDSPTRDLFPMGRRW